MEPSLIDNFTTLISNSNSITSTSITSKTVPSISDSIIQFQTLQIPPKDTLLVGVFIKDSNQDNLLTALVDTGAAGSLITSKTYNLLNSQKYPLFSTTYSGVQGIGGTVFPVYGIVTFQVQLSRTYITEPHPFIVVDDQVTNYDLIIGYDFLSQEQLLPDLSTKQLIKRNKNHLTIITEDIRALQSRDGIATIDKDISLPPNKCITIPISIEHLIFNYNTLLLFTPSDSNKFVMDHIVLSYSPDQVIYLYCFNFTDNPIHLKRGYSLGTLSILLLDSSFPSINVVELSQKPQTTYPEWTPESLYEAFDLDSTTLTPNQKEQLIQLLIKYPTALSLGDDDVGCTTILKHAINTLVGDPVCCPVRRLQGPILYEVEKVCQQLEADGIIRKSYSPYSAPVVPVRKPDGAMRLCIDYRKLNEVTKGDSFPIPNLTDTLFSLQGMKYFSTVDLIKGYYQIEMEEESIEKTAFSTPLGHWEFMRMPFGVKNGPATFQRAMRLALSHIPWQEVMIYLDDVLIISQTFEKHLTILEEVLTAFINAGFKLKPSKTHLLRTEVKFLGHQISYQGMIPLEKNIKGVKDFPIPKTVRQVRQFMGLVNFYRRHIPHCSEIAKPLFDLLKLTKNFQWTDQCQKAFDSLKEKLTTPPLLSYPDRNPNANPLFLHTDASGIGAGASLSQIQEDIEKPIAYISMIFSKAQQAYSTTEREVAAIRWAVRSLKPFLYGIRVVIFTDHKPLLFLHNMPLVNQRVARTLEELNDIDYELSYVPGKENIVADILSRVPYELQIQHNRDTYIPELPEGFIMNIIPGGGDSLFQCFSQFLHGKLDLHLLIRQEVVQELLDNRVKYHIPTGREAKQTLKQLQLTKFPGQLPFIHSIEAFSNIYLVRVLVYYSKDHPLHFGNPDYKDICCLICMGGIHYNLLTPTKSKLPQTAIDALSSFPILFPPVVILHLLISEDENDDILIENVPTSSIVTIDGEENSNLVPIETLQIHNFSLLINPQDSVEVTMTHIMDCQLKDPILKRLKTAIIRNQPFVGPLKNFNYARNSISIYNDYLIHRNRKDHYHYLVSFNFAVQVAIINHHEFAHIGQNKLYALLEWIIWHPKLRLICKDISMTCHHCQLGKVSNIYHAPPTIKINTRFPFELVAVDLLQLPKSSKGNSYIFVLIDHYSKWIAIVPLRSKHTSLVTAALKNILPYLPLIPSRLLSDNAREFRGPEFEELLILHNIKHIYTTPYNPSSNGITERVNRTLIQYLRGTLSNPSNWDIQLSSVALIYNNTIHSETKRSPAEIIFSEAHDTRPNLPWTRFNEYWDEGNTNYKSFAIGQEVALKLQLPGDRTSNKFKDRYQGPLTVIKVNNNNVTYIVQSKETQRLYKVHHKQLKKWYQPPDYLKDHPLFHKFLTKTTLIDDNLPDRLVPPPLLLPEVVEKDVVDDTPISLSLNETIDSDDDFVGFDDTDQINSLSQQLLSQLHKSLQIINKIHTSPVTHLPQSVITPISVDESFSFHLNELFASPINFSPTPDSIFLINASNSSNIPTHFSPVNLNTQVMVSPVSPQRSSIISYTPLTITNQLITSELHPVRRCFRRLSSENIMFNLEDSQTSVSNNVNDRLVNSPITPSLDDSFLKNHPMQTTTSSPINSSSTTELGSCIIHSFLQAFDEQGAFIHSTPTVSTKSVHWAPSIKLEEIITPCSDNETVAQRTRQKKPYVSPELPWVQDTVLEKRRNIKSSIKKNKL
ncbi:UNVERIFIED_CONTAM: hypothetical protein RMT77_014034 [Armadillidium vulgare]